MKQTHKYREQTGGCQRRRKIGGWVKNVKGLRNRNWQSQNSHKGVKYNLGHIVSNVIIAMCEY